ncbi:telomerase RNA component interacting RNase isoform X1 [Trichosurus vulpecula]|uniref:telomerase RNA component interacting RNase isoform X1 n=1 Tax=Trichosurus vulpecula TaxID=9337 RepID=UPI00186ACE3E|nr:telomerase RNA component interacting RNase isoform X1 [Trichosurus vulpecula]
MAARGRRAEPAGREPSGPAGGGAGGGGGSRWPGPGGAGAESGAGSGAGEEEEDAAAASGPASGGVNLFANDGSFLELFKRKMEEEEERRRQRQQQQSPDEPPAPPGAAAAPAAAPAGGGEPKRRSGPGPAALSFVGKRRGGNKLALKTGIVAKKQKTEDEVMTSKGDAWAKYMAEVKKYKAHQCSDDDKTRPLVK